MTWTDPISVTPPRQLSQQIAEAVRGTRIAAAIYAAPALLGAFSGLIAVIGRLWFGVPFAGAWTLAWLWAGLRVMKRGNRARHLWCDGRLTEAIVRKSTLAWDDYRGRGFEIDLDIEGKHVSTASPRDEGQDKRLPTLVADTYALVMFDGGRAFRVLRLPHE